MFQNLFNIIERGVWDVGYIRLNTEGHGVSLFVLLALILAIAAFAYFVGSTNTAVILSRLVYHEDIRTKGSGNAGTTNMMRTYGKLPAIMTLVGDMLKTLISMSLGTLLLGITGAYFAGLFAVLGHIFPIYYNFKGGKGVAATGMMILYINVWAFLVLFAVFVGVVWITRYLSLGSVIGISAFPLILVRLDNVPDAFFSLRLLISLTVMGFVIYKHKANIIRITEGKENKFAFKKTVKKSDIAEEKVKTKQKGGGDDENND